MLNLITIVLEWSPAVIYGYPAWDFPAFLCPLTRYVECTFLFGEFNILRFKSLLLLETYKKLKFKNKFSL
jgi:hypothetical protein